MFIACELDVLAHSCPLSAGDAVYLARSLNALYQPSAVYDDYANCRNIGNREVQPDVPLETLKVWPNPGTGLFYISGLQAGNVQYDVFDLNGRSVAAGICYNASLDLSRLSNGLYLLKLMQNSQVQTLRIVIER